MNKRNDKQKNMADTFDRLSGLDVDSQLSNDFDKVDFKMNKDLNNFIMAGSKAPRAAETYSEIEDQHDKDAIFNHSIKSGVFRNINNSPLRQRMPKSMQVYKGDQSQQFESKKQASVITANFLEDEEGELDIKDFVFNPKKFFCPSHPSTEIEYCN